MGLCRLPLPALSDEAVTKLLFIRPARAEERDALQALLGRALLAAESYRGQSPGHRAGNRVSPARIAEQRVLVVEREDGIFGFAVWSQTGDGAAELEGIFIEPAWWRQGMGRRLIEAVAAQVGAAALRITARPGEAAFFAQCGFVRTRKVETRDGPAIRMERRPEGADVPNA